MIVPSGHRVLVRADEVDEKQGSIYLPVETKERRQNEQVIGTIVRIGKTAWLDFSKGEPWAEEGDRVFYARNGGWKVKDPEDDKFYVILNDEDIVAVIKRENSNA